MSFKARTSFSFSFRDEGLVGPHVVHRQGVHSEALGDWLCGMVISGLAVGMQMSPRLHLEQARINDGSANSFLPLFVLVPQS